MNTAITLVLVSGCLVGLGVFVLVRMFAPVQTDLADGLHRLDSQVVAAASLVGFTVSDEDQSPVTRAVTKAGRYLTRLRISTPDADLAIIGWRREQFLALRILAPMVGLALGPLVAGIIWLAGLSLPWVFSVAESLVLAVVLWWYFGRYVHAKAAEARREMRYALVSYINVVALHRAAGAGIVEALSGAASVANSWAYQQIARQLDHSTRAGQQPWEGLAELACRLDIKELGDVGSIAEVSGRHGAAVFDTLLARARSLRNQLLGDEKRAATEASTRLAYPQTLLAVVVLAFLLFPALMRLLGGG